MKKVFPILIGLFLILPITNAFATTESIILTHTHIFKSGGSPQIQTLDNKAFVTKMNVTSPTWAAFRVELYDENNVMLDAKAGSNNSTLIFNKANVKSYKVFYNTGGMDATIKIDVYGDTPPTHDPITNLNETHNFNSINLTWVNPENPNFTGVKIKSNGVEIADLSKAISSYNIQNLKPETSYDIEVIAKYPTGLSNAMKITVLTEALKPAGEVKEVKAEATHERVDLSWTLPNANNLKHVIIYRDTLQKSFFDKMFGIATVKAATPIFETNGTYFNDLTVEPETKYEYKLTTLSTEKVESEGVTVQVSTPKEPDPEIEGGGHEKDPKTGDFTYTWTKPTTGEVKVMVGGKLYKTVPASDGKIIIPADDMKFTLFGKPNVELIPVRQDGTEGKPVSPPAGSDGESGGMGDFPFTTIEIVIMAFQIISFLSGLILLWYALQLAPRLIAIIKLSLIKGRTVNKNE